MKDNFDKWFTGELRQLEGGLANLEGDAGGYTAFGVARNFWPKWSGWPVLDNYFEEVALQNIKNNNGKKKVINQVNEEALFTLLTPHLKEFYYKNFWEPAKLDYLPSGIDTYMMSAVIHNGLVKPIKILQGSLGCIQDGKIGEKTIAAANRADRDMLLIAIHEGLKDKYKKDNTKWVKAFLNRAEKAYEFADSLP